MLTDWYSVNDLVGLSGLAKSSRGLRDYAFNKGWRSETRTIDGKSRAVYHVDSLPQHIQAALLLREQAQTVKEAKEKRQKPDPYQYAEYRSRSKKAQEQAIQRAEIMQELQKILQAGFKKCDSYKVISGRHNVPDRTIRRWWALVKNADRAEWEPLLAPKWNSPSEREEIDANAWAIFLGLYLTDRALPVRTCLRHLIEHPEMKGVKIPSERTWLRRVETDIPELAKVQFREGEEALKARLPFVQRSVDHLHALEWVNADGHTFDVFVDWEGETVRPCLVAFQDIYSRKILSWRLAKTENRVSVRLALFDLVVNYGRPKHVLFDNGRSFASKWLTGGQANRYRFKVKAGEIEGSVTRLGSKLHWAQPYSGQSKPIERSFQDLCTDISKHPLCKGAYTGNSPVNKPDSYGSKTVAFDDFLALVTTQIEAHNAREGRRSEMGKGEFSFDAVFERSYQTSPIYRPTDEQLRDLLLVGETVKVRQRGHVMILGNMYWSEQLAKRLGDSVEVRFDPENLKAGVWVYEADTKKMIGPAECWRGRFDSAEDAQRIAKARATTKRRNKAYKKAEAREIEVEDLLDLKRRPDYAREKKVGNVEDLQPHIAFQDRQKKKEDAAIARDMRLAKVLKFGGAD